MSAIRCPHCDTSAHVCRNEQQTPMILKAWHQCQNIQCGHTFVSFTEIKYEISPAANPRPGVSLPPSPSVFRTAKTPTAARWARPVCPSPAPARPTAVAHGRLHMGHLEYLTGLDKRAIQSAIRAGTFPGPVGMEAQCAIWDETGVTAWITSRLTAA